MSDWSFRVPPNINVALRARKKPSLLGRCLGDEVQSQTRLDLAVNLTSALARGSGTVNSGRYKGIPWGCTIDTQGGAGLQLSWRSATALREYLALHVALLPALRRLLLERDVALILGSAFEFEGSAFALSGATGSGKTSIMLAAVTRGARFIGDEYVGVSATGDVTPVLRVIALRRATLVGARHVRLHFGRRVMLLLAPLASGLTQRRLDPLVHVSPAELGIEPASGPTRLSSISWLERSSTRAIPTEPMPVDELIDSLSRAQDAHDRAYSVPEALRLSKNDTARWRAVLASGLRNARCQRLTLRNGMLAPDMLRHLIHPEPIAEHSA